MDKQSLNILITTSAWKSAYTAMISLARMGHKVSLLTTDPLEPHIHSKYCARYFISPEENDKVTYLKFLLNLLSTQRFDHLIPISDTVMSYMVEHRAEIEKWTTLILPPHASIDIAIDKRKTMEFAAAHNIPIPETHFPDNFETLVAITKDMPLPFVIKSTGGCGGGGTFVIHSRQDLETCFKGNTEILRKVLIQEYIDSRLLGFMAVCRHGEILDHFAFEVLRHYPERTGVTLNAVTYHSDELYFLAKRLVKTLNWHGNIDLDLLSKNGKPVLLEINPRFSGTTYFAYQCGIDLPKTYIQLLNDDADRLPSGHIPKRNVLYRVLSFEILQVINKKIPKREFLANFFRSDVKYDWSISDPQLLFWQIKRLYWSILSSPKKKVAEARRD